MWGVRTTESNAVSGWSTARDSPVEVVEPGGRHLARPQGVDQCVGVVELGPGRVEEDHPVAHGGELLGPDHARWSPG